METKTLILGTVIIAAIAAVAVAPIVLNHALAARTTTTTCTNGGGHTKDCGSPPANCETTVTKAGNGNGGGEIKSSTSTC